MDALTLAIAVGSGTVVGYGTAALMGASARRLLETKLEEKEKIEDKTSEELTAAETARKNAEEQLEKAQQAEKDARANVAKQRESAEAAQKKVSELKSAKEALSKEHETELESLRDELKEAACGISSELSAALDKAGKGLDDILAALVEHENLAGAMLTDANGITIARAGDGDVCDKVAAAASTITSIPDQLSTTLPLEKHFQFRLHDSKHAISGCTFQSVGELIALTTVGEAPPSEAAVTSTVESLGSALS